MATLRFYIPEQEFEFEIEDEQQLEDFRQAVIDEEGGDSYALMEMADMWTGDVHSAIDIDIEFVDE